LDTAGLVEWVIISGGQSTLIAASKQRRNLKILTDLKKIPITISLSTFYIAKLRSPDFVLQLQEQEELLRRAAKVKRDKENCGVIYGQLHRSSVSK